ncbi:hypothetical protein MP638_001374 [Amoeboaphelidium occidentale]|nr:hypothetical protein MP638_001374 [Amoeboaphelidium occidentale]
MALLAATNSDNTFNKYLSIKKPQGSGPPVILGMYKNYLLTFSSNNVFMVDVETGFLVKTLSGNGKGLIAMTELIDNFVVIYFADNWIQQWDLDTGDIVREKRLFKDSNSINSCALNVTLNVTSCCLMDGSVRRINLLTDRIEVQFPAHNQRCELTLNGSFVYTCSFDEAIKRFDPFGNLLATYEVSLGYANVIGFENHFMFARYYNIVFDRKYRIVRWNIETGLGEEFPLPMTDLLDPAKASKDYYFATTHSQVGVDYIQVFKNNMSLARTNSDGENMSGATHFVDSGDRFYFYPNTTLYELSLSDSGLSVGPGIEIEEFNIPIDVSLALNDTIMIVVYQKELYRSYFSKFLDLQTGVFSEKIEMFEGHQEFQIVDNWLVAAVGKGVVAYNLNDLSLAWRSPDIAPDVIQIMRYQEGLIYFATLNHAACHNATSFERIGILLTIEFGLYGIPDFLKGALYNNFVFSTISSYAFSDGHFLKQYGSMPNIVYVAKINGDYIYAANADSNIYKFDLNNEGLVFIFAGHSRDVTSLVFRGQFMYTGSHDLTIRKWNIDTGESLFIYFGHRDFGSRLHIRNNILYSSTSLEIKSWDLSRDRLLDSYFDKSAVPFSLLSFGDDLVSCSSSGHFILWNIKNGKKVSTLHQIQAGTYVTGAHYENHSIIFSDSRGSIKRFSSFSEEQVSEISDKLVQVLSAFFKRNEIIYAFGKNEGLFVKNLTKNSIQRLEIKSFYADAIMVVGDFLFSGNNDTSISKFDAKNLEIITTIKAHSGPVTVLGQFENQLISGSEDNSIRTWNIDSMNLVLDLKRDLSRLGHLGSVTSIYVEGDILFSGSTDTTVKRWDLSTGRVTFTYTGHAMKVTRVYVNNGTLFTAGEDEIIQIYNVVVAARTSTTAASTTTVTAARVPPVNTREPQESASISGAILAIIIGAPGILLIALGVSCKMLSTKASAAHESSTIAKISDIERTNNTAMQGMTLAPTNIGISIPASKLINETDFIIAGKLGKGGGGDVFFAVPTSNSLRKHGDKIVAKRFKKKYSSMSSNEKSTFDQEIGIMEMLGGRGHFAELLGYTLNPCTILMKLYSLGSLTSFMKKMDAIWSIPLVMSFAQDIFMAVGIMHKLELAHCDLKPDNILIEKNDIGRYICVLTDFGITQILSDSIIDTKAFIVFNVRGLSVRYAAPETFKRFRMKVGFSKTQDLKAGDVYSVAVTLFEMLARKSPWN